MDEDFLDVTNKGNKLPVIVFLIIIVSISVFGYFYIIKKDNFTLKNVRVELGSNLSSDVNDYLKKKEASITGYELDISSVKTNEIGTYKYYVTYGMKKKSAKIIVEDTTAPTFTLKSISVEEGDENFYLGSVLDSCIDPSGLCLVSFVNEKDQKKLKSVGKYDFKIKISDVYGNFKTATCHIDVVAKGTFVDEYAKDLEFDKDMSEIEDFKEEYYYKKREMAIKQDENEVRDEISEISAIDFEAYVRENYSDSKLVNAEILTIYNKHKYVVGYAVKITVNTSGVENTIYLKNNVSVGNIANENSQDE